MAARIKREKIVNRNFQGKHSRNKRIWWNIKKTLIFYGKEIVRFEETLGNKKKF